MLQLSVDVAGWPPVRIVKGAGVDFIFQHANHVINNSTPVPFVLGGRFSAFADLFGKATEGLLCAC
jgi:hypothetical protein